MTIDEQITAVLEDAKTEIQRRMAERGINATGRTSLSFRVEKDGTRISLIGGGDSQRWGGKTAPIDSVEIGRGPGGDYKQLRPAIVKRTIAKGFNFQASDPREEESIRWAVSTVIAKRITAEGTRRHREPEDVYSTPTQTAAAAIRSIINADIKTMLSEIVGGRKVEVAKTNF